jgi:hypothetical protein
LTEKRQYRYDPAGLGGIALFFSLKPQFLRYFLKNDGISTISTDIQHAFS